jgi:hypothetical protein
MNGVNQIPKVGTFTKVTYMQRLQSLTNRFLSTEHDYEQPSGTVDSQESVLAQ